MSHKIQGTITKLTTEGTKMTFEIQGTEGFFSKQRNNGGDKVYNLFFDCNSEGVEKLEQSQSFTIGNDLRLELIREAFIHNKKLEISINNWTTIKDIDQVSLLND